MPLSKKLTVPVGGVWEPEPGATTLTDAVRMTDCPKVAGLGDAASVVVVAAWFTIWVAATELLVPKRLSPP